mgnify:CR=1 FL=1
MFYYVYILVSLRDNKLYIGYTDNLKRRVIEHNRGESFSTKPRRPFKLIYYEAYLNKEDAHSREKFFKSGWGRQYIKKSLKNFLSRSRKI